MLFGCHVSIAGGIVNAPKRASDLGCEVFQMFTRSPQGGSVPPITDEIAETFKLECQKLNLKEWVIHTPYFINFASGNNRIRYGSSSVVRQELERGSSIGAAYIMAHLGSYKDLGHDAGLVQVVEGLDRALDGYTGSTQFLIEISAGAGDVIGDRFEEIAEVIDHPKLLGYGIGVCFDTQHAFGSGYDLRTPELVTETFDQFDRIVGLKRLKMSHCNDSKVELGAHKDRHEHIGDGFIGIEGFRALVQEKRLQKINFYCETEHDKVAADIEILKKLRTE